MTTIFVSSTFRDMQHERDAIQHMVAPQVNEVARRYGQSVSFCDLRWGIDTQGVNQSAAARKILDVCLDEIDRSDPPMVVLIGYRYGWTPLLDVPDLPGETPVQAANRKVRPLMQASARKGMRLDDPEISVTELEVLFGGLAAAGRRMPMLCYIREITPPDGIPYDYLPEDGEQHQHLQNLKRRIERVTNGRVRTYCANANKVLKRGCPHLPRCSR